MPSLRPASTFRLWRIRTGSRVSVTTAWPSAASVGARMIASTSASGQASPSRRTTASTKPARIVSGSPIPRSRAGTPSSRRSARRSMREASEKRTTASVASARTLTSSPSASGSTRPSASTPTTRPAAVKTIGAVSDVPSSRADTAAKARRTAATLRAASARAELRRALLHEAGCLPIPPPHPAPLRGSADGDALQRRTRSSPIVRRQPVERAVEAILERGRAAHARLEVERLHDEGALGPLGLQVRAADDPVAPQEGRT